MLCEGLVVTDVDTVLVSPAGLIRSLSAFARDSSQICREVNSDQLSVMPIQSRSKEEVNSCRWLQKWSTPLLAAQCC